MVDYQKKGNIALIYMNNPPVNALSTRVRVGITDALDKAVADSSVEAIILAGKGQCFCAGADIKEFAEGSRLSEKGSVFNALEECKKPVIAAIHGYTFGGGFEVALSSHYRVAHKNSIFGFPEVDIGILPAGGGTQRFPRLAGLKVALDVIPTGKRFKSAQALKWGVLDKCVAGDVIESSIEFAKSVIGKELKGVRCCDRSVPDLKTAGPHFDTAIVRANKTRKGMLSPIGCIQALRSATNLSFDLGIQKEKDIFYHLVTSGQAQALQYAFFAQRVSAKWKLPNGITSQDCKPDNIKTAAVIGAGTMGAGIAVTLLNVGIPVTLVEQDQKMLDAGVSRVKGIYEGAVSLGKMIPTQVEMVMSILKPTMSYEDLVNVDLVIEAVFENMDLKKRIFTKLDSVCKPEALLCTNTSTLSIDKIASSTKRPGKVMGAHFFVPAYIMPLMENIYGKDTSPQTVATVMALGKKLKKTPVLVGNCHGFVGNRMLGSYVREAEFMLEEGAEPSEIDRVLMDFGFPLGPLGVADLSGIDIGVLSRREKAKSEGIKVDWEKGPRYVNGCRMGTVSNVLYKEGRLGRKAGRGYYLYDKPGSKNYRPDPRVSEILSSLRRTHDVTPRRIPHQEIVERCLYPLINEGFKILEEKIASKPEDIDVIWLTGYGWPKYTGGPMYYAKTVGLKNIYDRLKYYHQKHPTSPHMMPCELLRRLSESPEVPMSSWINARTPSRL